MEKKLLELVSDDEEEYEDAADENAEEVYEDAEEVNEDTADTTVHITEESTPKKYKKPQPIATH